MKQSKNNEYNPRYSTGEIAGKLEIHQQTVRKWCNDYKEFIVVPRDENNKRFFTDDILKILEFIKELKDNGENIHVIKKILSKSKGIEEIKEKSVERGTPRYVRNRPYILHTH